MAPAFVCRAVRLAAIGYDDEVTERDALERRIRAACDGARWNDAATAAIEGYGPEVLGYLYALTRNEVDADDCFSLFCESLWLALPRFRWESTLRTWAYVLARHAWHRKVRDPQRRVERRVPLSAAPLAALADKVKTRTLTFLRSEKRNRLLELRDKLEPDDQTLLILRIDRALGWRDIARVMSDDEDETTAALDRRAATLRKRYERLKADLASQLRGG